MDSVTTDSVLNIAEMSSSSSSSSSSATCFEVLTVHPRHGEFCKGILGDFILTIHKCTGFVNASKLCSLGNKRYSDWIKNKNNLEYVETMENEAKLNGREVVYNIGEGLEYNEINGTYVCEHILYQIAQWVSIDFRMKASTIISNFYREQKRIKETHQRSYKDLEEQLWLKDKEIISKNEEIISKNEEIIGKNNEIIGKNNEIIAKNNEIIDKNNEIVSKNEEIISKNNEIYILEEKNAHLKDVTIKMGNDYVPKLDDTSKRNVFAILDKGTADSTRSLTTIRSQKRNYETAFKKKKKVFPNAVSIYQIKYHPNAITFFNQIKQEFPGITTRYNDITLPDDYSVDEFIEDVDRINRKAPRSVFLEDVEKN